MKIQFILAASLFIVLAAAPGTAQVVSGSVDTARQVTLTGAVKSIQWGTL